MYKQEENFKKIIEQNINPQICETHVKVCK